MKINVAFVNTGLDERIVKSVTGATPAKTEKMVLVHDSKKGDYYRKQVVNVDQPNAPHNAPKQQKPESDNKTKDLNELIDKLKSLNVPVTSEKLPTRESEDKWLVDDLNFDVIKHVDAMLKKKPVYRNYTHYSGEGSIDYRLGNKNFDKLANIQPGARDFKEYDKTVTPMGYAAVRGYTFSKWTYPLNNWLRDLYGPEVQRPKDEQELDIVKTFAKELDKVIDNYELKEPTIVHRAIRISVLKSILSKGDGTFKDDGFSSTTALNGAFSLGSDPVVNLVIRVPAGKGYGAWLKPYSKLPRENEFLLGRGTTFKIHSLDVTYDADNKPINALLEVEVTGKDRVKLEPTKNKISGFDFITS